jgi:hypothetical protein
VFALSVMLRSRTMHLLLGSFRVAFAHLRSVCEGIGQ